MQTTRTLKLARTCINLHKEVIYGCANKEQKRGRTAYYCDIKYQVRPQSSTKRVWTSSTCIKCKHFINCTLEKFM